MTEVMTITGEEILLLDQRRVIEQTGFTYLHLGKPFEKQIKVIEYQEIKQVEVSKDLKPEENQEDLKSIEVLFPREMRTNQVQMKKMKLKNLKIKLKEKIYNVK